MMFLSLPFTRLAALTALGLALALPAHAHKASDAYLRISDTAMATDAGAGIGGDEQSTATASPGTASASAAGALSLSLSIALKDVDAAVDQLDADADRLLTWGEVRQAAGAIAQWVGSGVQWTCTGAAVAPPAWRLAALEQRSDGRYARLQATLDCAPGQPLALGYSLMQGVDPTHRLLVAGSLGGQPLAAVLVPDGRATTDLRSAAAAGARGDAQGLAAGDEATAPRGGLATLLHFVSEGVHHILEGYDHLAFLLALLLPITLWQRQAGQGAASAPWGRQHMPDGHANSGRWAGLRALFVTVTCFTLGHSVTLALAGLGIVQVSGNWVEPAIAVSIGISALLNLYPVRGLRGSWLALGFGLVHGLGFSGVLVEAGVSGGLLLWALAGFNLGVEAVQLALVALWCVVSMVLMRWRLYNTVVVRGGSAALVALSLYWTVQRVAFAG
ncbi:HupE/UreJ family protein [Acidovorax sp. RAC01]|uniref:HupE/UreJ family protein n=1 Tax=Acidovorax sp. RAC01 TaxID=1842533 RepID=UPI00083E8DE1|nr:HupE/UreJ family protein [Acidovorax sp. RAC01]AOG24095.1 hupE / UreJ family protein [Acidovorax sp. RAC01]